MPTVPSNRRIVYLVLGFVFLVGWILPIAYVGFTNRPVPIVGKYMNYMWRIAALFPRRSDAWDNYFYEVRLEEKDGWVEVPFEYLGKMRPFGAGNRIHRIMAQGGGDRNRAAVLRSVALWIKQQYELHSGEGTRVAEVRFVRRRYPVGSPQLVEGGKAWIIPELSEISVSQRTVWRQYRFDRKDEADQGEATQAE